MATLMIQGTTSDAGKSTVVAGLCRVLKRRGISVAPFKPQNMALNSAMTAEGGEIGRSTALQAQAAGVEPHSDMNPVLLKPSTDRGAQVILRGRPYGYMDALDYHAFKRTAQRSVMAAWQTLCRRHDVIIAEGAGSPAEINLRAGDIANMGFAEAADCPVLLVGDIDRGGVFAQLVGTLALLSESEQARTRGFIINRFRGDIALLTPGLDWLEARTDKPVMGTLPYIQGLLLDAEDGIVEGQSDKREQTLSVAVIALPRISNHTDFDPLRAHPQVNVTFVGPGRSIPPVDAIILPSSQSVISDLRWLEQQGFAASIQRHLRYGGRVLGIGGGQQMLGEWIDDSGEAENTATRVPGLGLLPITSRLTTEPFGFIRAGDTAFATEGTISNDGQVLGTALHGLFEYPDISASVLSQLGLEHAEHVDFDAHRECELKRLADTLEQQLDMDAVLALLKLS
ncbi:MAG: cobyric acid synthase [Halomonas sp.]|nr:cobyric acid synthase [Halomonas sp.]MDN6296477.1 cobyric acid synthase [Halomonas sp.]MDN6313830.1 cobyric acid synthase [Halomonas sp.]MDN6335284.1 cobyric acid synthase [Halomonas sp.]